MDAFGAIKGLDDDSNRQARGQSPAAITERGPRRGRWHRGTPAWSAGKGFELYAGAAPIGIASVEIVGQTIQITADADLPASGVTVAYALGADPPTTDGGVLAPAMTRPFVGTFRWGLLRDSDPFVGSTTLKAQPNFAVAFELPVP